MTNQNQLSNFLDKINLQEKENENFWKSAFPEVFFSEEEYDSISNSKENLEFEVFELQNKISNSENINCILKKENKSLIDKVNKLSNKFNDVKIVLLLLRKSIKDKQPLTKQEKNLIRSFVFDDDLISE